MMIDTIPPIPPPTPTGISPQMGNVWSKKPLKEVMRENKRMINRAIRELDRERTNLERSEASTVEGGAGVEWRSG
jgi:hypothetical protein